MTKPKSPPEVAFYPTAVPMPSVDRIMAEDLKEARENHRDAWGPAHTFKRMGARGTFYECEAVDCQTRLIVQADAYGSEDDE